MGLNPDLCGYRSWVFDCDGVLLNSNPIKTEAFRQVASVYGTEAVDALVDYHRRHGGVSRFRKIAYLFETILDRSAEPGEAERVLDDFAAICRREVLVCAEAPGLRDLLVALSEGCSRLVVSGAEENELRWVLEARGLAPLFDAIHGSPAAKPAILADARRRGLLSEPGVFVGDSLTDYQAATQAGLDFVFVSRWTEMPGWQAFFADKPVRICDGLDDLLGMAA